MKQGVIVLLILMTFLSGCTAGRNEYPETVLTKLELGETVYVCGCPMMCCNSISRIPNERCSCNFPLKKGIVAKIQDGRVSVKLDDGREKRFFITNR